MNLVEFLENTEKIKSVEEPEVLIMVGPPGSGKTFISKQYQDTHVVIDVDKLRKKPDTVENIDEDYYRYTSQFKAEERRDSIIERMVLKKKNFIIHVLTGANYWYEQALNIKYSGYKIKFVFILTNKKAIDTNIEKKNKEERESQGYAIVAESDFINYSFETIPQLLVTTLKDNMEIIDKVILMDQDGKSFDSYSKEDIYRALKTEYIKSV